MLVRIVARLALLSTLTTSCCAYLTPIIHTLPPLPPTSLTTTANTAAHTLKSLPDVSHFSFSSILLSDGLSVATYMNRIDYNNYEGVMSTVRTFVLVLIAALFGIAVVLYLTGEFLLPNVAEQLEGETKELWEEYEAKLDKAESFVDRLNILEELEARMETITMAKIEKEILEED